MVSGNRSAQSESVRIMLERLSNFSLAHDMYPPFGNEQEPRYSTSTEPIDPNNTTPPLQPYAPPYFSAAASLPRLPIPGPGRWSTGLCHCCDDPANCVITCCCPCITFGRIAEIVDKGNSTCVGRGAVYWVLLAFSGLACLYSCFYRSKLRGQFELEEAPCVDCLVHFCCETCALCQEYRELKNRGFDMGIGWEANMDRQNRCYNGSSCGSTYDEMI